MRLNLFLAAPLLVAGLAPSAEACTEPPAAAEVQESLPSKVANPIERFARMVDGAWRMTSQSGMDMFDRWHKGPGMHSMRVMTDGHSADGNPWRALWVVYWHPRFKIIRSLGLSPYKAGVSEGTVVFDGQSLEAVFDMHQTGRTRKLKSRWTFDGPDKYHDELLESNGTAAYTPLTAWDRVRIQPAASPSRHTIEGGEKPPARLVAFESLLGHAWESSGEFKGEWVATGTMSKVKSSVELIPLANGIYIRTTGFSARNEPTHLLDTYIYHHTGADVLRCLGLSSRGGVYEGDLALVDGGALETVLNGFEFERDIQILVRIEHEQDGSLRHRAWSVESAGRALMLDVRYRKVQPK